MVDIQKLSQELVAAITNESRNVRGSNLRERLDLLNAAYHLAAGLDDLLKTIKKFEEPR